MDSALVLAKRRGRGRVLGASFDNGLGFKACESWVSGSGTDSLSCLPPPPPPPPHRICLIVGTNHEKYIYILSLGGVDTIVDEPRPNLRIPVSFRDFRFCIVDSTLYALKIRWNWEYDLAADVDEVYTLRLSDKFSDVVLEDKMLERMPVQLRPKEAALPLPVGKGFVLFFSTFIRFHSKVDDSIKKYVCDFELYDTIDNVVQKVPQLWIRPKNRSRFCTTFQLFHPRPQEWEDFSIFNSHPHSTPLPVYFSICAYAFHQGLFLIQTDFGRLFGINPFKHQTQWQLMDKDMNLRSQGQSCDPNFIMLDERLCIDAFGIHKFYGASGVEFPLSYFPSASRSFTLLDRCTLCIVRATDPSCEDSYDFSTTTTTPCWCVDVIKVDFSNVLVEIDQDGEKKVNNSKFCIIKGDEKKSQYMNNTMSFKFCIKDKKAHSIHVVGLFPF